MPITAEYDRDADALYVRIAEGDRVRAIEIDATTYVDVDAGSRPLGIELLYPSTGLNLLGVTKRLSLESRLGELITAITQSGAPVEALTMTGGQYLASTSIVHVAVEGTIGATASVDSTTSATSTNGSKPLVLTGC